MQKLVIRKSQPADWPYIKEKLQKYALDGVNAKANQFFAAEIDGKIKGFGRIIDRKYYIEVASLGVDYYHRGKGIGKRLLGFLIKEAKRAYPDKDIYGVTHRPGFLAPFGFKEVEEAPPALKHKKYNECILGPPKIKIMRLEE
jgi:N-acetylglutamate synthase-like GNAT family acetyltransferase